MKDGAIQLKMYFENIRGIESALSTAEFSALFYSTQFCVDFISGGGTDNCVNLPYAGAYPGKAR